MGLRKETRKTAKSMLSQEILDYLQYGAKPAEMNADFYNATDPDNLQRMWDEVRDEILSSWIRSFPGTRPFAWWKIDAKEPRQRLGGVGTPAHEVLGYAPLFNYGIPVVFVDQWMIEYYNGRRMNTNGERIGTRYKDGDFVAEAFSDDDPPQFESQATYLKRVGLLTPAEAQALKGKKAIWKPEVIER